MAYNNLNAPRYRHALAPMRLTHVKTYKKAPVTKVIRRIVHEEEDIKQNIDAAGVGSGQVVTNAGIFRFIHTIPQSTASNGRSGNRLALRRMEVRGYAISGLITAPQSIRLIMLRDLQPNGAVPTSALVFRDNSTAAMYMSAVNQDGVKRFKVYKDTNLCLNTGGGATDQEELVKFRWNIKFPPKTFINYNDSAATGVITTVNYGNFIFVMVTDAASNGPTVFYSSSVWYNDA